MKELRVDFQDVEAKAGTNGRILSKSQKEIYDALRVDTWKEDISKISVVEKLEKVLSPKEMRAFSLYAGCKDQKYAAKEMGISQQAFSKFYKKIKNKIKNLGKDIFL
jgi:DNA-directed RNA polymerase specialized sigma subunit